jgi:hypothetical protein
MLAVDFRVLVRAGRSRRRGDASFSGGEDSVHFGEGGNDAGQDRAGVELTIVERVNETRPLAVGESSGCGDGMVE